jgi:uracil-DNA glycosylase
MDKTKKRSRDSEPEKASNKRQTTLLSMFKPINAPPVVTAPVVTKDTTENPVGPPPTAVPSNKKQDPEALFKDLDKETRELLDLEIRTMNYEWLKVLAPELVKPYFLKVSLKLDNKTESGSFCF